MADCNRTDNTELKKPQQETDPGINGITASDRRLDALTVGSLVSQSKQEKSPEPFSKVEEERYEPYEVRAGASGSYPQKESQVVVLGRLNSKIVALEEELKKLHLQKDHEVKHLKGKLAATERQAERAEQQLNQKKREHQIERSASNNQIKELRCWVNELQTELSEAQENLQLEEQVLKKTQQKVTDLQIRVNELELEKEGKF